MPVVLYSVLRLLVLAVAAFALYAVGLRGWLLVVVAVVVAWTVAYVAFRRQRDAAVRWLARRSERRAAAPRFTPGVEADADAEDAEAERLRRQE